MSYLYEELGDKRFQELCQTVLLDEYPGLACLPTGQKDGGRDALTRAVDGPFRVFQVKFTKRPNRRALVSDLEGLIRGESKNLKRLVTEGLDEYIIVTNIATTSARESGTYDTVERKLDQLSSEFEVPMRCIWRDDLDRRVDRAPTEVKFAYGAMLVGHDAIRYLLAEDRKSEDLRDIGDLLRAVVAAQWHSDENVKFHQVELDSQSVVDLFVDLDAVTTPPRRSATWGSVENTTINGVARALLHRGAARSVLRGAPGQGKSTVVQYVCQAHRATFLERDEAVERLDPGMRPSTPRVALKIDLRDFGTWVKGYDPFDVTDLGVAKKRPAGTDTGSFESFLAALMRKESGGLKASVEAVRDIMRRFPCIIALDGLDEIAEVAIRSKVVAEIELAADRLQHRDVPHQFIVTTRPNFADLAEPSPDYFEYLDLQPLRAAARVRYLHKWAAVQRLKGAQKSSLERIFAKRSAEDHVRELAQNPMQLTILLYLIKQRGESIPSQRTELYRSYMDLFLDREASKDPKVQEHRRLLVEVTAYLGWELQARAEAEGGNGRATVSDLRKTLFVYLDQIQEDVTLVDVLFTKVTARVWALTSRFQGTFEFDVQPIREYFAAKYLAESVSSVTRADILKELALRPYWFNTARFLAGFLTPGELAGAVNVFQELADEADEPTRWRTMLWTLLADGIFESRKRDQGRAVQLLRDAVSVRLICDLLHRRELPALSGGRGGAQLAEVLLQDIEANATSTLSVDRSRLLTWLEFDHAPLTASWINVMRSAEDAKTLAAWLVIGGPHRDYLSQVPDENGQLLAMSPAQLEAALDAGAVPQRGGAWEAKLVDAVLAGQCFEASPPVPSYPGYLALLLSPAPFLRRAPYGSDEVTATNAVGVDQRQGPLFPPDTGLNQGPGPGPLPSKVLSRLKGWNPGTAHIRSAFRESRGQKGTTSAWSNTARAISEVFGPCWPAAQIAAAGAASSELRTGGDLNPGAAPLGAGSDYGVLVRDARGNRTRAEWWSDVLDLCSRDPLQEGTWALFLVSAADGHVILNNLAALDAVVQRLPEAHLRALLFASARIGTARLRRLRRGFEIVAQATDLHWAVGLMVSHQVAGVQTGGLLGPYAPDELAKMAATGAAGWPAIQEAKSRLRRGDTSMLMVLRAAGPQSPVGFQFGDPRASDLIAGPVLDDVAQFPMDVVRSVAQAKARSRPKQSPLAGLADESWLST